MGGESLYLAVVLVGGLGAALLGRLRLDVASLLILLSLLVPWRRGPDGEWVGILTTSEAFSGFGSPVVVMVGAIFVLSAGMEQSGAAQLLGSRLLNFRRGGERATQAVLIAAATLFSAFVSDTTTVLVWMPLALAVGRERNIPGSRLLLPLAVAALLGGQWTLIGTRANLVASDQLRSSLGEGLGFFEFTPVALAVWLAAMLFFFTVGRRLLPRREAELGLADRYQVTEYLTEVMATTSADMVGKSLRELDLGAGVRVLGVIREDQSLPPDDWLVIRPGDVLIIQGSISSISGVVGRPGVEVREEMRVRDQTLRSVDLRMVEAVVGPGSSLEGRNLAELDFHRRYNLSVLAIGRRGRPLQERPLEAELKVGDSLLLVGHEERIAMLRNDPNVLLLETRPVPVVGKAWTALACLGFLVLASASGLLEPPVAIVAAGLACVLTGCISARSAYRAIDWRILVVLGCMIPYGMALERSGTAEGLARTVAGALGGFGPLGLLAGLLLVAILVTQILENSAAAVLLSPIAYEMAVTAGSDPRAFLLGTAICCSAGFATPMAHECTLLVMGPGGYRPRDFLAIGLPLAILTWLVTLAVLPLFYTL